MPTIQREIRYLTAEELIRLRRYAEARALQVKEGGAVTAVRSWALLDTLLSSGLRASEVASLRVGDCLLGYGQASLVVRQGKGDKQREVFIPQELRSHLKGFLTWKRNHGEDSSDDATISPASADPSPATGSGVSSRASWRPSDWIPGTRPIHVATIYPVGLCRVTGRSLRDAPIVSIQDADWLPQLRDIVCSHHRPFRKARSWSPGW
jgi:integrase